MVEEKQRPIGIFDSGIGGVSCLGQGIKMLPNEKFIYYGDSGNPPYSLMSKTEVKRLCIDICDFLIEKEVKAIVVACNSATSVAITDLRKRYDKPILGMEPAVKVAVDFGLRGKILVMATGMTLQSNTLNRLIEKYGEGFEIVKLPCRDIISLVEAGVIDGKEIEDHLREYFEEFDKETVSTVVFGCTHFVFLEKSIKKVLGDHIRIADGNEGTIRHLRNILKKERMLNDIERNAPAVEFYNSGGNAFIESSRRILHKHLMNLKEKELLDSPPQLWKA